MGSRGDERERQTAKKWRSQQIKIMMREWTARDLEWLVRRAGGRRGICSVYLLRSRMHDHNPAAVPRAFSSPPEPLRPPSLCLPPCLRSLLDLRLCCRSSPFVPRRFLPLSLSCRNLRCVALLQSFRIRLRLH